MIYHITTMAAWKAQAKKKYYEADSLKTEGFIHCSTATQIDGVLNRYYKGVPEVLLLHINEEYLVNDLKYETATAGELFPHIYGNINKSAIVKTEFRKNIF